MADPFSITLGVLQLTGAALKVSSIICRKIRIFRNYSREVKRVLKGFERQRQNFVHEVHLCLRQAQQPDNDILQMLDDANHPNWTSRELQLELETAFGARLDACRDTIEEIGSILNSLQGELVCFDEIVTMCPKHEPLKEAVRHLRKRVKITFDKVKFEQQIKTLRELNYDLRSLRKQAAEIKEPVIHPIAATSSRPSQQLSEEYGTIGKTRRASKALHQALAAAWLRSLASSSSGNVRHSVKILLNTGATNQARIDVVISCYGHWQESLDLGQPPLGFGRYHVESQVVDFMESTLSTPPSSGPDAQDGLRKKRRTVRFVEDDTQTEESTPAASDQLSEAVDLRSVEHVCTVLAPKKTMCRGPQCPVYLDGVANETFRHTFFESPVADVSSSSSIKMSEILNQPVETSVNFVDQLKLARDFVMTVLKFHSTPWLREHYTIHDLSFFRSDGGDVASYLQTAHLGLDFIQSSPDADCSAQMADICNDEAVETARLTHGVRNLTLWSLGAVLLQIGTWSTIEHLDDVAKIRRLAQRVPMLGKRYRDLTKQCLECDFAFGDDLSKPRLQQAVYENVVCGLSDMIRSLDIGDE